MCVIKRGSGKMVAGRTAISRRDAETQREKKENMILSFVLSLRLRVSA
jgi:hypothetical protein